MINLLPKPQQRELKITAIYHRLLLYWLFLLLMVLLFIAPLLALNYFLKSQNDFFQQGINEKQKRIENNRLQGFRDLIIEENRNLAKVQNFWKSQVPLEPSLEEFLNQLPSGIYLRNATLSFSGDSKEAKSSKAGAIDFSSQAFAVDRDSLQEFLRKLQSRPQFSKVNFTASAWLKPTNIDFTLSLTFQPFPD